MNLKHCSLKVQNYCLPGLCPQLPVSKLQMKENKRILLLSGLDFFNTPDSMKLELLTEWITGIAGDENSQNEEATICQIIIAGMLIKLLSLFKINKTIL